jgi:hypothetical protein
VGELGAQIERAFAAEKANPAVPLTRADIPQSYEVIGPDWLTDILCRDVAGAAVVDCTLGPPDEGTNNRRRIHLRYNHAGQRAGLPASVFCKSTQGLANRLMLGHSGGVLCEVTFWNAARTLLDIEAPTARFAAYDPVSFNSIIVLDDLGKSATFCSHDTTVGKDFAKQQLALLAGLHGRFFEAPELSQALSVLPNWEQRFRSLMRFHLEESCTAGVLAAESFIPPPVVFAPRRYLAGNAAIT